MREPIRSYPPLHYCGGRCCPFIYGWLRDRSLCYLPPPYTTDVGADAARFFVYGWCAILYRPPPPHTTVKVDAARFLYGLCVILYCPTPSFTTVGAVAARFYAVGGANLYCASPYTARRVNATCFGAMSVGVLGDPSLSYPLRYTQVKRCLFWCDECRRVGRPFTVLPPSLHLD